jgi:hypothetical protein
MNTWRADDIAYTPMSCGRVQWTEGQTVGTLGIKHERVSPVVETSDIIRKCLLVSNSSQSESKLLSDGRFTANQFVLATSPLRPTTRIVIFQLNTCCYSPYVTFSLTSGWVCRLQLLLVLTSAVILRSESRGTHDHILLSHIRDPQPGRPGSPIPILQEQGGSVIPPGTGFPFRRLLRLARLRWRYWIPPPYGMIMVVHWHLVLK